MTDNQKKTIKDLPKFERPREKSASMAQERFSDLNFRCNKRLKI
jgi:hypothetical protein